MKKPLLTFLLILLLASGALINFTNQSSENKTETILENRLEYCKIVFPNANSCLKHTETIPHFRAYTTDVSTGKDKLIGLAFLSTETAPKITGYAGKIKMIVGVDLSGNITKAHIISHAETPRFVRKLNAFMRQFTNKNIHDPFELGNDINMMTRATITSKSITRAIKESLNKIGSEYLDVQTTAQSQNQLLSLFDIIVPCVLFSLAVCGLLFKNRKLKWSALIGSFLYLGIMKASMLSIIQIANIGLWQIPSFTSNPLWFMVMGLTLFTLLFFGNIYCSSICPFCAIQDAAGKLFSKTPLKKIEISPAAVRLARKGRYWILFLAIIISYILGSSDSLNIETFVILFSPDASFLGWFLVGFMVLLSLFHFKFWCKYLCPVGTFNELVPRIRFRKTQQPTHIQKHPSNLVKGDITFLIILISSYFLLFGVLIENIFIEPPSNQSKVSTTATETASPQASINTEKIKTRLKNAGIVPREAKYWETID